jgi:hypothetical protein
VIRVPGETQGPLSKAWAAYLVAEHHTDPLYAGGCTLLPPDPSEHAAKIAEMPKAWNSPSPVITTLDWQYRPAAAAALEESDTKPAYYCERFSGQPKIMFVTAVIPTTADFPRWEAQVEWQKYVRARVDSNTQTGGCDAGTTRQETVMRSQRIEQYRNQGYTIKEVTWVYTPGATPAPPPAPVTPAPAPAPSPPPAAPQGRFPKQTVTAAFYCQYLGLSPDKEGKYPLYQNEVFTATGTQRDFQQAWARYVDETFKPGPNGNATCAQLPSDAAQQAQVLKGMMAVPRTTMKVMAVSWKP